MVTPRLKWSAFCSLLLAGIVVFCTAVGPVRAHLQALAVMREMAGQPVPWVAGEVTGAITRQDLTFKTEAAYGEQEVRARMYAPANGTNAPPMVIFHGVHHLGIDEPRLMSFAAAMASCGIRVLTPELPDIKDYRVSEQSVQTIGGSVKWFASQTGAPVAVMGLSFSGGLALVAAADPAYHPAFKFVMAVQSPRDTRIPIPADRIHVPAATPSSHPAADRFLSCSIRSPATSSLATLPP